MEDILASIRRIIDDDETDAPTRHQTPPRMAAEESPEDGGEIDWDALDALIGSEHDDPKPRPRAEGADRADARDHHRSDQTAEDSGTRARRDSDPGLRRDAPAASEDEDDALELTKIAESVARGEDRRDEIGAEAFYDVFTDDDRRRDAPPEDAPSEPEAAGEADPVMELTSRLNDDGSVTELAEEAAAARDAMATDLRDAADRRRLAAEARAQMDAEEEAEESAAGPEWRSIEEAAPRGEDAGARIVGQGASVALEETEPDGRDESDAEPDDADDYGAAFDDPAPEVARRDDEDAPLPERRYGFRGAQTPRPEIEPDAPADDAADNDADDDPDPLDAAADVLAAIEGRDKAAAHAVSDSIAPVASDQDDRSDAAAEPAHDAEPTFGRDYPEDDDPEDDDPEDDDLARAYAVREALTGNDAEDPAFGVALDDPVAHDAPPPLDEDYSASLRAVADGAALMGAGVAEEDEIETVGGMVREAMTREVALRRAPEDAAFDAPRESVPAGLVSQASEEATARALAALADAEGDAPRRIYGALPVSEAAGSDSIEGLVRAMLRPMLKEWLDQNLPSMVETMVRAEVERISARSRRFTRREED